MKKNVSKNSILFLLLSSSSIFGASLVESTKKKIPDTKSIFKSIIEDKEEQLAHLKKDKSSLEVEKNAALKALKTDLEEIKNKRAELEKLLTQEPEDEFLNKALSLLTTINDVDNDLQRIWEGFTKKIADHIGIIEKYLKDPEMKEYRRDLKIVVGPYFFEDLENIHQKITSQQQFIDQLKKRKEGANKEQKNLAQLSEKLGEEYKEAKAKQEEFGKPPVEAQQLSAPLGLNIKQRAELAAIESNLLKVKKDLVDLQLRDKKAEVAAIETELFLELMHLEVLQESQRKIKAAITVTYEQIDAANQELERKKQAFSSLKARYNDEITKLRKVREDEAAQLTQLSQKYGITLGNELSTWSIEPQKTRDSYLALCEVGQLNTEVLALNAKEAYLESLIALEQEKIDYAETMSKIKETYYKIVARKFVAEDEIGKQIRLYGEKLAANEAALKSYRAKKDELESAVLKLQNEINDHLKKRRNDVQQQRETVFKGNIQDYARCLAYLDKAQETIAAEIDTMTNSGKSYTEIIAIMDKLSGHLRFIAAELESITIWYRPEYAISWNGILNIWTDTKHFIRDLRSYFKQLSIRDVVADRAKEGLRKPALLIALLIKIILILSFALLLRRYKYTLIAPLQRLAQKIPTIGSALLLVIFGIEFLAMHSLSLGAWFGVLCVLQYYVTPDPYLYILFYLASIPYLIYLAHHAVRFLYYFNAKHNFVFISHEAAHRVMTILSVFMYASITLMLLRESLLLSKLPKSELPKILLALNIITSQVCLVLLLTKDFILWLIPTKYDFGQAIYRWVDRYYYLLIGLIAAALVLSNPYVGYGRLVAYLLMGLFYSVLLAYVLMWLHGFFKKGASSLFFTTQAEIVKERFSYAKTFFGLAIIVSFVGLAILGFMVAAKIWGWPVASQDVLKWLNQPLFGIGKNTAAPLTLLTVGTIALFVFTGFLVAFGFNRFVLDKIFDLMLVDAGVQHAFTNMVRYLIVIAAILLGLQSVGYGGLITYFYVLILGIGYLIQNPLNDLFAYFILLIQRPIKIGDYIKIDNEIVGVVRKITPKSVVVRRKNSITVVIPNSMLTTRPVFNWNYSANFIAFDDITITVAYKEDPERVKALLLKAVDAHPKVLKSPKPVIRLDDFNERGYEFMVRGFLSPNYTLEQHDIASDIRIAIIKILRAEGVEIAVPIRVVANATQATFLKDK